MKLYAIIYYYEDTEYHRSPAKKVVAIMDEENKNKFFMNLNMFARDYYDYEEAVLNDFSGVEHMMVEPS